MKSSKVLPPHGVWLIETSTIIDSRLVSSKVTIVMQESGYGFIVSINVPRFVMRVHYLIISHQYEMVMMLSPVYTVNDER